MKIECGDCDWTGDQEDIPEGHHGIERLTERIDPGSEVPAGECPECGSLCYVLESENPYAAGIRKLKADRKELLRALRDLIEVLPLSRFNIRKDFSIFNCHAAAAKAIYTVENKAESEVSK